MALSKVAVVVGVGPGAGAGAARRFAKEGYKIALVSRKKESTDPIEKELKAAGGDAISVLADTGKPDNVREAHNTICKALGNPEVLIYNAGPGMMSWPPPTIMDIPPEVFSRAFDSGVTGALVWAQQMLPAMVEAKKGTIIMTGATASLRGSAKFTLLACPKFALRALSQTMAREFQPKGVHVAHVIIDGGIDRPQVRAMMPDRAPASFLSPDAIGDAYWFLHSQDSTAWTQELDLRPAMEKF